MENNSYNIVVNYLAKEFKLNKSKLNLETSLMSGIGLDGDDVLDFLLEFFKEFGIEYEQTNYRDFIPPERGSLATLLLFPLYLLFPLFGKKKRRKIDKNEIFVKDLVVSLDKKKWYKMPL
jgi:hypothetical protein